MDKGRRKMKGLPKKVLALLLCFVCLLAVMPISALALEVDTSQTLGEASAQGETVETEAAGTDASAQPDAEGATDTAQPDAAGSTDGVTPQSEATAGTEGVTPQPETTTGTEGVTPQPETTAAPEGSNESEGADVTVDTTETETVDPDAAASGGEEVDAAAVQAFYEQVMAAQSCEAIFWLMGDDENYAIASALSVEQVKAIKEYAQNLEADDYQEILLQTINELLKNLGEDVDSEYSTSETGELNAGMYKETVPVYWDTISALSQSADSYNGAYVESVSLGGNAVTQGYSKDTSWGSATTLKTYFPGASANNMTDATLNITAKAGYYVTGIVVACAPTPRTQSLSPFQCATWSNDNEFIRTFKLTESKYENGTYKLSFDINSVYFSHNGGSTPKAYFILIQVNKVPTPLYVEYNYGNVKDFLNVDANSAFASPTWTVVGSGNNYGTGSVYTTDTQFAYAYDKDTSVLASWKHTANSISGAALAEAAAAGYRFTGWAATYYNDCKAVQSTDSYGNNYTMSFANQYMTGTYNPGDPVQQLQTNVRLVAQWAPIQLKMTKTVEGLSSITEHAGKTNTYTLELQKQKADGGYETVATQNYVITGDETLTYTFAASGEGVVTQKITSGTYRVVETGNYDITGTSTNAYCTTTYPAETVVVGADGTVQELKVLNTYSATPAAYTLTVTKTLSGNMYSDSDTFKFTVTYGDQKEEFELGKNGTETISIPVGVAVSVTEVDSKGYKYSLKSVTPDTLAYNALQDANGISFTMPASDVAVTINNENNVELDTGVFLDSLPYVIILVLVLGGVVAMATRSRRKCRK